MSMNKYIKYGFIFFILFIIFLVLPTISGLDPKTLHGELLLRFRIFALIGVTSFIVSLFLNIYGLIKIDKSTEKGTLLATSILFFEILLIIINFIDMMSY